MYPFHTLDFLSSSVDANASCLVPRKRGEWLAPFLHLKTPQYLGRSLAQFIYNGHNLLLQINTTEKKGNKESDIH